MLTNRHLAVIRAALKFFDEEMSPSGGVAFASYLDEADQKLSIEFADVKATQTFFQRAELAYALVDIKSRRVLSDQLAANPDSRPTADHNSDLVQVTVLLPKSAAV